jgi:lipopolysaccharide assembly outer membrane protein LptD (OstA)
MYAQVDTSRVEYLHSDSLLGDLSGDMQYSRLLGNVQMQQNGTTLFCDSAHWFQKTNFIECFGHVVINAKNGATVNADYIKYTGNTRKAFLKGNVQIVDGGNTLTSNELDYDLRTKIATYNKGATLLSEETTLISNSGIYNGFTKESTFRGDVLVNNPKYEVSSKALKYNSDTKVVTFLDLSNIITEDATIVGSNGVYDSKKEEGKFNTRSTILNDDQEITANTLYYNKQSNAQKADGNVNIYDEKDQRRLLCEHLTYNNATTVLHVRENVQIDEFGQGRMVLCNFAEYIRRNKYMRAEGDVHVFDSAQQTVLECDTIQYNLEKKLMSATGNPLLRMLADKDSMFIRATQFYSAPSDSINYLQSKLVPRDIVADSTKDGDTSVLRTLLAIGKVRLFGDSMQALADSLSHSDKDSTFRLYKKPILWANQSQATADTIYLQTANKKAKHMQLLEKSFLISDTKATDLYNQISGRKIDGDFVNDALDVLFVDGSARSIYFPQNDKEEYEGCNSAEAAQLRIQMKDKKVNKISFYTLPKGKMIPMEKLTAAEKKLEGFTWLEDLRPKTKEDVINYVAEKTNAKVEVPSGKTATRAATKKVKKGKKRK